MRTPTDNSHHSAPPPRLVAASAEVLNHIPEQPFAPNLQRSVTQGLARLNERDTLEFDLGVFFANSRQRRVMRRQMTCVESINTFSQVSLSNI
jgi:hypothetical protein